MASSRLRQHDLFKRNHCRVVVREPGARLDLVQSFDQMVRGHPELQSRYLWRIGMRLLCLRFSWILGPGDRCHCADRFAKALLQLRHRFSVLSLIGRMLKQGKGGCQDLLDVDMAVVRHRPVGCLDSPNRALLSL